MTEQAVFVPQRARRGNRFAPSHRVLFPLAAAFAALLVPWWVAVSLGAAPLCAACQPAARHAHEMVFGYALAVVAGFLVTKVSRAGLAFAVALWAIGRAAVLADLPQPIMALATLAFPVLLFAWAGLPFLMARKGHGVVMGILVGTFAGAEALYQAGTAGWLAGGESTGAGLALDLITALLFVMGGRVIPGAAAAAARACGVDLTHRVQPRLEWAGLAGMAVLAVGDLGGWPALIVPGATLAGTAALVRLARWRPWLARRRPDTWSLLLGYCWLGAGLLLRGLAEASNWLPPSGALHAITIGALGTLSLAMMVRVTAQREGRGAGFSRMAIIGVLLASLAAAARLGAAVAGEPIWLAAAGAAWSGAFLLLLAALYLLNFPWRPDRPSGAGDRSRTA